jgi:lysozyme
MDESIFNECVELVKQFEGFRAKPYLCPAGYWTIGYGTRCKETTAPITQEQAEQMLRQVLQNLQRSLKHDLLSDAEVAALSSLAYNIGLSAVRNGNLYSTLTQGRKEQWFRILYYSKSGDNWLRGLLRRRCAELILAHGGDWRTWEHYDKRLADLIQDHSLAYTVANEIIRGTKEAQADRAA